MSPQLADSEFSPVFRLLTIFAYGTYADYLGEAGRGAPRPGGGDPAGRERRRRAGAQSASLPRQPPRQPGPSHTRLGVLWAPD